ncbi:hypothetical protein N8987_03240 [Crocinitomix sp.]|nr:hypothetical protein [Crocinitomix sp.]
MNKIYLFESGSTKTTVLITNLNRSMDALNYETLSLPGYNPNRPNVAFLEALTSLSINPNDQVYFYGSGLASIEYQKELSEKFRTLFNCKIEVNGDLTGAARATLHNSAGIVAILGTGGVVGYYNEGKIQSQFGGYGYLIDDVGGGYELGKRIVSAWLNGELSNKLELVIERYLGVEKENFIREYYSGIISSNQKNGLDLIGKLTKVLPPFMEENFIDEIVVDYFDVFFKRHVNPLMKKTGISRFSIVGSIGWIFQKNILTVANRYGIEIDTIIQYPAENLLKYHQKTKN